MKLPNPVTIVGILISIIVGLLMYFGGKDDEFSFLVCLLGVIISLLIDVITQVSLQESQVIQNIHHVTGNVLWDILVKSTDDPETKARHTERVLETLRNIRQLTSNYLTTELNMQTDGPVSQLIERGIIWPAEKLHEVETGATTTEIWLFSHDFKPDSYDTSVGRIVNRSLKKGRKYVYFYPADLPHFELERARLFKNIGLTNVKDDPLRDLVRLVPIGTKQYDVTVRDGNILLCFFDTERTIPPRCFEEVIFTKFSERGIFWQEHDDTTSNKFRNTFEKEFNNNPIIALNTEQ